MIKVPLRVVIVAATCSGTKSPFGIRVERGDAGWSAVWAFRLRPARWPEGQPGEVLRGGISLGIEYPGCPHCGRVSFYKCGTCERIACWSGDEQTVTCPSCGASGTIEGVMDAVASQADA
jgi:hypothetical protein